LLKESRYQSNHSATASATSIQNTNGNRYPSSPGVGSGAHNSNTGSIRSSDNYTSNNILTKPAPQVPQVAERSSNYAKNTQYQRYLELQQRNQQIQQNQQIRQEQQEQYAYHIEHQNDPDYEQQLIIEQQRQLAAHNKQKMEQLRQMQQQPQQLQQYSRNPGYTSSTTEITTSKPASMVSTPDSLRGRKQIVLTTDNKGEMLPQREVIIVLKKILIQFKAIMIFIQLFYLKASIESYSSSH
jgi:hypothetical protein